MNLALAHPPHSPRFMIIQIFMFDIKRHSSRSEMVISLINEAQGEDAVKALLKAEIFGENQYERKTLS